MNIRSLEGTKEKDGHIRFLSKTYIHANDSQKPPVYATLIYENPGLA